MHTLRHDFKCLRRSLVAVLTISMTFGVTAAQDSVSPSGDNVLPKFAIKRFGSLRFLPNSTVDRIEYSADGRYLATITVLAMRHIASVPGQQRLITAGLDETLKCWDLTTKKIVYEIQLAEKSRVSELHVSPNGHYLAVGEAHYGHIQMRRTLSALGKGVATS